VFAFVNTYPCLPITFVSKLQALGHGGFCAAWAASKMVWSNGIFSGERPSSGIAGWRGGWNADIGSEGTRPALLSAGPVPERLNVKLVFIETPHGPAINWTSLFALFYCPTARSLKKRLVVAAE